MGRQWVIATENLILAKALGIPSTRKQHISLLFRRAYRGSFLVELVRSLYIFKGVYEIDMWE